MFDGSIPKSLRTCSTLVVLFLHKNQLAGDISEHFGVYPNLMWMRLSSNRLSGQIPPSWGANHQLQELDLAENMIKTTH